MQRTDHTRTLCAHLYARTVRQLKQSSPDKLTKRLHRLHKLERSLHIPFGRSALHYALPLMLAAMLGTAAQTRAQVFADPVVNPFGLADMPAAFQEPELADLDGDRDMDLFLSGLYYENIGIPGSPNFAPPVADPFGLGPGRPNFVDLDGDGDLDVMKGSGLDFLYKENMGSVTAPVFGPEILLPFGLISPAYLGIIEAVDPAFGDLDNDGDLDMATAVYIQMDKMNFYYENIGTETSPMFAPPVQNALITYLDWNDYLDFQSLTMGDVDHDGDIDVAYTYEYGYEFWENEGTPEIFNFVEYPADLPAFFDPGPNSYFFNSSLKDIDNDGDIDWLVVGSEYDWGGGVYNRRFYYFENTLCKLTMPTGLTATGLTPTSAVLNWSPADSGYDFVVKMRDLTAGGIRKKYVSEPTYTFTSLTPGHDYAFAVWTECADFDTRRGPSEVYYFSTPMRSGAMDVGAAIFPNPGNGNFTINLESVGITVGELIIYNVGGEKVYTETIGEGVTTLSIYTQLPAGLYKLMINSSEQSGSATIIIQ